MRREQLVVIAPPWYPVPPVGYGGIELVVALLAEGLTRLGHPPLVFGAEGSAPGVRVEAPRCWRDDLGRRSERLRELTYAARIRRALARETGTVRVIHDHTGFSTLLATSLIPLIPVVHTVHGPIDEPTRTFYTSLGRRVGLIAISDSQRASAPDLNWLGRVYNAVDVDSLQTGSRARKEGYLLCLARICPDKGQHLAVEVARRTGRRLVLAGKIEPGDEARTYFHRHIAGAIDGDRVIHLTDVGGSEKSSLLARASALLAPITWEEPFGLAMAEAIASGTPVVAMARGAAPEVVNDGESGFLVTDVDEMVAALGRLDEIDPARCAELGRERFSPEAMASGYLAIYDRMTSAIDEAFPPRQTGVVGAAGDALPASREGSASAR